MADPNASIIELLFFGVFDAGHPNEERLVLRPQIPLSLHGYGMTVGFPTGEGALPIFDQCFWFPDIEVASLSWVVLFTGPGKTKMSTTQGGVPVLALHWQRPTVIFTGKVVPVLFRVDGSTVGAVELPADAQQPGRLTSG